MMNSYAKRLRLFLVFSLISFTFIFSISSDAFSEHLDSQIKPTANWWNNDWSYRKKIEITNNYQAISNYQFLLKINDQDIYLNTQPNGEDIRFAGSDNIELSFFIEMEYLWN